MDLFCSLAASATEGIPLTIAPVIERHRNSESSFLFFFTMVIEHKTANTIITPHKTTLLLSPVDGCPPLFELFSGLLSLSASPTPDLFDDFATYVTFKVAVSPVAREPICFVAIESSANLYPIGIMFSKERFVIA